LERGETQKGLPKNDEGGYLNKKKTLSASKAGSFNREKEDTNRGYAQIKGGEEKGENDCEGENRSFLSQPRKIKQRGRKLFRLLFGRGWERLRGGEVFYDGKAGELRIDPREEKKHCLLCKKE